MTGDEIIVAAGAIGSPRLLLLSGIGPAAELSALGIRPVVDLPGVGRNLRDHPVLCASWRATSPVVAPTAGPATTGQVGLRATTPGSDDVNDMRLMSYRAEGSGRFGLPLSLMRAKSSGTVRLASSDRSARPLIDLRHLDHPSDLARMRSMLEVVVELGEHPAFAGLRGERITPHPKSAEVPGWMLRTVVTGHHASGTCMMGPASNPAAVVDETGRVHGVAGLRVVDSSVMVDCPRVNINATTMMIAEKLAAHMTYVDSSGAGVSRDRGSDDDQETRSV